MRTFGPLAAAVVAFLLGWAAAWAGVHNELPPLTGDWFAHDGHLPPWAIAVAVALVVFVLGVAWTRPTWFTSYGHRIGMVVAFALFAVAVDALCWAVGAAIGGHHETGQLVALIVGLVAVAIGTVVGGLQRRAGLGVLLVLGALVVVGVVGSTKWHVTGSFRLSAAWATGLSAALVILILAATELVVSAGQSTPKPAPTPASPDSVPVKAGQRRSLVPDDQAAAYRRRGLRAAYVGVDGRVSTSKLQVALWTLAVLFMLIHIWVQNWCLGKHCDQVNGQDGELHDLAHLALQPEYWALLGLPAGAAVYAMALLKGTAVDKAAITAAEQDGGILPGLRETTSNDIGAIDLGDLQYFAFNLFGLAYVLVLFLQHPFDGLPPVPGTIVGLIGVSAATYATKKTVASADKPSIDSLTPGELVIGTDSVLVIDGANFLLPGVTQATSRNDVLIGGRSLRTLAAANQDPLATGGALRWTNNRVSVDLREYPTAAAATAAIVQGGLVLHSGRCDTSIVVRDSRGIESDPAKLTVRPRA